MEETLAESLRSILYQLDERFEVLVVDDGSTDGSQEILDRFEEEYDMFWWVEGNNNNLAEARNHSFRIANGDYILESLDVDDRYEPVIKDFVTVFEELQEKIDMIYLSSDGLNIAPKRLLLDIEYRSLGYGEDKDLWRLLLAENAIVILEINKPYQTIGYEYDALDWFKIAFEETKVNLRSGVTLASYLHWKIHNLNHIHDYFKLVMAPIAFLLALYEGRFEQPDGYEKMGRLPRELETQAVDLSELEEEYDLDLKGKLSNAGRRILYK
jgi:glycosyltransferase involved in cell wall biosynthesis